MSAEPAAPRLLVLSGLSGAGKTTLAQRLLRHPQVARARTATTRAPRGGEQDGVDYHFLDDATFDRWLAEDAFLETAEVYGGHRYGTPRKNVEAILASGRHCLLVVDVQGAAAIRRLGLPALLVFVRPPDLDELARRLRDRGEDDETAIADRLTAARRELDRKDEFDLDLVNDDVEAAARALAAQLGLELEV